MAYNPLNPNGSATSANSSPVVIASDQAAIATVAPVPSVDVSSSYAHTASASAYAFGEVWLNNATAGSVTFPTISVAKAINQPLTISGGKLVKSGTVTTNALFRIHLFTALPTTAVADYGAYLSGLTVANEIGTLDCNIALNGSDVSYGVLVPTYGSTIITLPVSGAQTLYWVPEVRGAYTPVSAETLTLTLTVQ